MNIKNNIKYQDTENRKRVFDEWVSFLNRYGVQYQRFSIPDIVPDIIDTVKKTGKISEKQFKVLLTVGSRLTKYRNACLQGSRKVVGGYGSRYGG